MQCKLAGGRPWRLVFRLFLCWMFCAPGAGIASGVRAQVLFEGDDVSSAAQAGEFFRIAMEAAAMAAPGTEWRLENESGGRTPGDLRETVLREAHRAKALVDDESTTGLSAAVEGHLVAGLAKVITYYADAPDAAGLRRFFHLNRQKYPPTDQVWGWRLTLADDGSEATSGSLAWMASRREAGVSFPQICAEFNLRNARPEMGNFGPIDPAALQPVERDAVLSAPLEQEVGPLRVGGSMIFLQVDRRVLADGDPVEQRGERLLSDYLRVRWGRSEADRETSLSRALSVRLNDFDTSSPLGARQVAFNLGGRGYTFEQTRTLIPPIMGDETDPRFWPSVARQALEHERWRAYGEHIGVRDLPVFLQLRDLVTDAVTVTRALDYATSAPTQKNLEAFLAAHGRDFAPSDRVDLLRLSVTVVPTSDSGAQRESLRKIVVRWRETPTTSTLEDARRDIPDFEWQVLKDVALDDLPREEQIILEQTPSGEPSPVIRVEGKLTSVVMMARRKASVPKLEKIRSAVHSAWRMHRQGEILEKVGPVPK